MPKGYFKNAVLDIPEVQNITQLSGEGGGGSAKYDEIVRGGGANSSILISRKMRVAKVKHSKVKMKPKTKKVKFDSLLEHFLQRDF